MKTRFILILIAVLLAAACQPQPSAVVDVPTLAVLPSLTPSDTPTPTDIATSTPTPTDTLTPTPSDTPTNTATFTPTLSATPSVTVTSSITPTFTLTFTATATDTPTVTNTPNAPQILQFTSSSPQVAPGGAITLRWNTVSDAARIDQLNQQGIVSQTFSVASVGELTVTVPTNLGRQIVYRLVALRGGQEAMQSIPIQITCPIAWFFGNEFAPVNAGCPTSAALVGDGKFQPFERGLMIYVNASGFNRVYGLQNENSRYISYVSQWNGSGQPGYGDPPNGSLVKPREQFRWAFLETLAPNGTWEQSIGWGTTDVNRDSRTYQLADNGTFFIDTPGGAVYQFSGGDSGTWTKVK